MPYPTDDSRDRPWVMRTYAGHSSAKASNELYRRNLAKGQTGLSVAFDLPTQTGYDPDDELARGEVGKVGVPVSHIGDMRALFDAIPLHEANTSMTINATAMWLLALYVTVADEQADAAGLDRDEVRASLAGTTQNDIVKEYLSRGTYAFPPAPSVRLITDMIAWTVRVVPKWNPINICSYHLQEAGATPTQEVAYTISTAIAVLDAVRDSGQVPEADFAKVVGRISFFVNAGLHIIEEIAKLRAFSQLWDELCQERYGVTDPKMRRFRYGVQVNSLGLTEAQPENNVQRIVLEMLAVTLSKDARARAVQLPAWNEALGLPRPWDQQWALRMQQVLAYETDVLDYEDVFEGSHVMEAKTAAIVEGARTEIAKVAEMGGAVAAVDSGYMKSQLVSSLAARRMRLESGEDTVVGVNKFTSTEPSPLQAEGADAIFVADPDVEERAREAVAAWRGDRDDDTVKAALDGLTEAAGRRETDDSLNLMEATLACAKAGVTTGEWAGALRGVYGSYRAPTGVAAASSSGSSAPGSAVSDSEAPDGEPNELDQVRERVRATADEIGVSALRMLVGKPGLDGHSNGAEQIAVRARDAGFEVIYQGIRLTPGEIVAAAVQEGVHVVGLSILSGSHLEVVPAVLDGLARADAADIPVVVGGIIPPKDAEQLVRLGVQRVVTPKSYSLTGIMGEFVDVIREVHGLDLGERSDGGEHREGTPTPTGA